MTNIVKKEENKSLSYSEFTSRIVNMFNEKTPREYVKKRKGAGGRTFDYVEVGYVIKKLNSISPFWNFEIVEEKREGNEIYVKGRLTIFFSPDFSISKEQYGSSQVKMSNGRPISLGDDFKAAGSDALKKCASMFGIAHDVYFQEKELDDNEEISSNKQIEFKEKNNLTKKLTAEEVFEMTKEINDKEEPTKKQLDALNNYQEMGLLDERIDIHKLSKGKVVKILTELLKR